MSKPLRPIQQREVDKCLAKLREVNQTILIAPTGAGKTVMLSYIVRQMINTNKPNCFKKAIVICHRSKINEQNKKEFEGMFPNITTSLYADGQKNTAGKVVFATIQSLKNINLHLFNVGEKGFDVIAIDEFHHAEANTYKEFIKRCRDIKPNLTLFGATATPNRGDKKNILNVINNVGAQITISQLFQEKLLMIPEIYKFKLAKHEDRNVVGMQQSYEKNAFELMRQLHHFKPKKTIIFATDTNHLDFLETYLVENGFKATGIHANIDSLSVKSNLDSFENGDTDILINVNIATEGYNYPPIDCVVLMRALHVKGSLIQMVGRGLRTHPDKQRTIVLDFGGNFDEFGDLHDEIDQLQDEQVTKIAYEQEEGKGKKAKIQRDVNMFNRHYSERHYIGAESDRFCEFDFQGAKILGAVSLYGSIFKCDKIAYYRDNKSKEITKIDINDVDMYIDKIFDEEQIACHQEFVKQDFPEYAKEELRKNSDITLFSFSSYSAFILGNFSRHFKNLFFSEVKKFKKVLDK